VKLTVLQKPKEEGCFWNRSRTSSGQYLPKVGRSRIGACHLGETARLKYWGNHQDVRCSIDWVGQGLIVLQHQSDLWVVLKLACNSFKLVLMQAQLGPAIEQNIKIDPMSNLLKRTRGIAQCSTNLYLNMRNRTRAQKDKLSTTLQCPVDWMAYQVHTFLWHKPCYTAYLANSPFHFPLRPLIFLQSTKPQKKLTLIRIRKSPYSQLRKPE
jgi:hypothetical protein